MFARVSKHNKVLLSVMLLGYTVCTVLTQANDKDVRLITLSPCYSPPGQYWAGRTLPPNNLPPNMAANDLRCSEMPHYCRVVIRV